MSKLRRRHTISQQISLENQHETHKYDACECQVKIELYCMCVCLCVYVYMCMCAHVCICSYVHVCVYICVCMYVCVYICVCTYVCMCVYVRIYVCMYYVFMCMYVCVHMCIMCICDLLCQNPTLTHTMSMNSFHHQWIAPSINYLTASTPLPNVDRSAFTEACF